MRYIAAVVLEGFYASMAKRDQEVPFVLYRDRRVLDVCPLARERGVALVMPLAEAKAILAGEGNVVAWEEEPYRGAQRRWLRIVSEFSDTVEPLLQHEALIDLTGHPRPREAAIRMEEALRDRLGLSAKAGVAGCRWVARLAARRGDPLGLAQADPSAFVAALPVHRLPIDPRHTKTLELLGYRTAGDVTRLDRRTLRSQFGADALQIETAAKGEGERSVKPVFPADSVASRFVFENGAVDDRQALDRGLSALAQDLGESLRTSDAVARRVELFLEREDATVERRSRTFARSIADVGDVLTAVRLMLSDDPERSPEAIRARLTDLTRARRVQLDVAGGRSRTDQVESVRVALRHVAQAFGDKAVIRASEKPEPRWFRVRRAYMEVNGFVWT